MRLYLSETIYIDGTPKEFNALIQTFQKNESKIQSNFKLDEKDLDRFVDILNDNIKRGLK